ncbi:hypothetical protein ACK3BK_09450 [Pseudomonas sp. L7]|uniref:hypothetical protein n=1 Tax=Pseudomonas sp. L7 TaxID=3388343 RepID=UPI0039852F73
MPEPSLGEGRTTPARCSALGDLVLLSIDQRPEVAGGGPGADGDTQLDQQNGVGEAARCSCQHAQPGHNTFCAQLRHAGA